MSLIEVRTIQGNCNLFSASNLPGYINTTAASGSAHQAYLFQVIWYTQTQGKLMISGNHLTCLFNRYLERLFKISGVETVLAFILANFAVVIATTVITFVATLWAALFDLSIGDRARVVIVLSFL